MAVQMPHLHPDFQGRIMEDVAGGLVPGASASAVAGSGCGCGMGRCSSSGPGGPCSPATCGAVGHSHRHHHLAHSGGSGAPWLHHAGDEGRAGPLENRVPSRQGSPSRAPSGLLGSAEGLPSTLPRLFERAANEHDELRECRNDNLRWRLWAVAARSPQASGDAAGGPCWPPALEGKPVTISDWVRAGGDLDALCMRETRWEYRCVRAARRLADLESSQRVWQQGRRRVLQFWQQRRGGGAGDAKWPWASGGPRTSSPPLRTIQEVQTQAPDPSPSLASGQTTVGPGSMGVAACGAEGHVLVAVPMSRLEAVARVLAEPY